MMSKNGERKCANCWSKLVGVCNSNTCQCCSHFEGFRQYKCTITSDDAIDTWSKPCNNKFDPQDPCTYHKFPREIDEWKKATSLPKFPGCVEVGMGLDARKKRVPVFVCKKTHEVLGNGQCYTCPNYIPECNNTQPTSPDLGLMHAESMEKSRW